MGLLLLVGCGASPAPATSDAGNPGPDANPEVDAPDLRFKWVGAGFRLQIRRSTNGGTAGAGTQTFGGPIGATPLLLTGDSSSFYFIFSTDKNLEPMVATAASGSLEDLDADLGTLVRPSSVVISLDTSETRVAGRPVYNSMVTGTESADASYTPFVRGTVAIAEFPAWVSSQGAQGRVVTALGPKDGALYATAFGRAGDSANYETQVVTTAIGDLATAVSALASAGYFITAVGRDGTGSGAAGGFVIVGTRAAGRLAARSIEIEDVPCIVGRGGFNQDVQGLFNGGFALVGAIFHGGAECDGSPTWAFVAQK